MHPMMLHFPIVLIIFYIVWALWITPRYPAGKEVGKVLLLTATLTAAITAIMGIILSKEDGYDADALVLHKWSGIAVAILSFTWYILDNRFAQHKILLVATASVVFVLLVVAGDLEPVSHMARIICLRLCFHKSNHTMLASKKPWFIETWCNLY